MYTYIDLIKYLLIKRKYDVGINKFIITVNVHFYVG